MTLPFSRIHHTGYMLLLLALLTACLWAYWPGLHGGFLFDDFPNIVLNPRLGAIEGIDLASIRSAISQAEPGPIGRPVSFISFAINTAFSGLNPYYFKLTNLAIHLLNGVVLFSLVRILLSRITTLQTQREINLVALTTTGAWLLHPLNLTSVLYVVQRMTELSALFVFISLLLYSAARTRQIEGESGAPLLFSVLPLTFLLAVFSKENGVLLIAYLFTLELTLFRFKAKTTATAQRLRNLYLALALFAIPTGLVVMHHYALGYGHRSFTLAERLLSECRIVWFYIQSILLPDIRSMTLFHDDFVISTGLFSPPQTLLALLGLIGLLISALWLRNKARLLVFGLLFFFSSHLLESSVIPLELIHEHRNYVGSWGLLLPVSYYLLMFGKRHGREMLSYASACLLIVILGVNTHIRSQYWGNELSLVQYQAHHHPDSYRSMLAAGSAFASNAVEPHAEEYLDKALDYYLKAYQMEPSESKALVSIVSIFNLLDDGENANDYASRLLENLKNKPVSTDTSNAFVVTSQCMADNGCRFPLSIYKEMSRALLSNDHIKRNKDFSAKVYSANSNIAYLEGDIDLAIDYGEQSIALFPSEVQYYLNQAILMISSQRLTEARDYISQARALDKSIFIEKKISAVESMLKQHEKQAAQPENKDTNS
ncbi:MAG: hypothetical protein KZQ97_13005 [Candidatus Thiodiazotropha sp. (ex Dulcina madagascariensis)]|nr:hypothetical protein [Candidatus Thiodiazotropha sp. (ex Dulcina madagascariensis)]